MLDIGKFNGIEVQVAFIDLFEPATCRQGDIVKKV